MTAEEGYKVLFDSLLQTDSTKGDYFIKMAKELAIDPTSFFTDLKSLYDTMVKYVNTIDHEYWAEDEEGNREELYNTINVYYQTNGRQRGHLSKENIGQFLPGLEQFEKILKEHEKITNIAKNKPTGFENIDSIYDKVVKRCEQFSNQLDLITSNSKGGEYLGENSEIEIFDSNKICIEFDQFVKEFPTTYEKYLPDILKKYQRLKRLKNSYIASELPVRWMRRPN